MAEAVLSQAKCLYLGSLGAESLLGLRFDQRLIVLMISLMLSICRRLIKPFVQGFDGSGLSSAIRPTASIRPR